MHHLQWETNYSTIAALFGPGSCSFHFIRFGSVTRHGCAHSTSLWMGPHGLSLESKEATGWMKWNGLFNNNIHNHVAELVEEHRAYSGLKYTIKLWGKPRPTSAEFRLLGSNWTYIARSGPIGQRGDQIWIPRTFQASYVGCVTSERCGLLL